LRHSLAQTVERDPFAVLGPHRADDGKSVVIRARHPAAESVAVRLVGSDRLVPMRRLRGDGTVFDAKIPATEIPDYRLRVTFPGNHVMPEFLSRPDFFGRVFAFTNVRSRKAC